jgi:hypothetical protein
MQRLGWITGSVIQWVARADRHISVRLAARGMPLAVAQVIRWGVKLVLLVALLYVTVWLALLVAFFVIAAWVIKSANSAEPTEWAVGEQADYKQSVFYDPLYYNDDPDSRFDDKR